MPKVVKTKTFSSTKTFSTILPHIVTALSEVLGAEYGTTTNADSETIYYIPMKNVGYDGWFLCIRKYSQSNSSYAKYFIAMSDDSGLPKLSDEYVYPCNSMSSGGSNAGEYLSAVTAVLFRDVNNDTVLINVHAGSSENGGDTAYYHYGICTVFFGRDESNDVLCGMGLYNITGVRTKDKYIDILSMDGYNMSYVYPGSQRLLGDVLHLTKMVNYLSPTMAEMKSAYVTVVRPNGDSAKPLNPSFYADGALWGVVGRYDNESASGQRDFPPLQPFVKY